MAEPMDKSKQAEEQSAKDKAQKNVADAALCDAGCFTLQRVHHLHQAMPDGSHPCARRKSSHYESAVHRLR